VSLEVKSVQGQLLTAERSGQTAVKDIAQLSQKIVALEKELKVLLNEHQVCCSMLQHVAAYRRVL